MQASNRRVFMIQLIAGTAALSTAQAAVPDKVKETDPYPKSMGFRYNTAEVDKAKFPRHTLEQYCGECQLYSGKPNEEFGHCSFFKRHVPVKGWCRNFKVRKSTA